MTVQYQQFGVIELESFEDETAARARYADICADQDTSEAWLFDGPGQDARALEHYWRSGDNEARA